MLNCREERPSHPRKDLAAQVAIKKSPRHSEKTQYTHKNKNRSFFQDEARNIQNGHARSMSHSAATKTSPVLLVDSLLELRPEAKSSNISIT